ncbi:MAG: ABC transporter ATP-binding protein [Nitrospirae bacterium]|nr:ABC transporter ATP-binding protein [Nitrospirota bacterium]
MNICSMTDIHKSYKLGEEDVEVLRGINLSIEQGEFAAIMGTSGSGKTTLMNLIGCLDVPTSGSYNLADREVSIMTDDELSVIRNEHIGFVFQNFYLMSYATVLENVLLPTLYTDHADKDTAGRAMEILRLVGLSEKAKFKPNQLSGGQQQRVAIARALINNPEIILCDEPTGQLDSKTAFEIMDLLKTMNSKGKTIIVVTHDPNIAAFAKRIIMIKDGVIVS